MNYPLNSCIVYTWCNVITSANWWNLFIQTNSLKERKDWPSYRFSRLCNGCLKRHDEAVCHADCWVVHLVLHMHTQTYCWTCQHESYHWLLCHCLLYSGIISASGCFALDPHGTTDIPRCLGCRWGLSVVIGFPSGASLLYEGRNNKTKGDMASMTPSMSNCSHLSPNKRQIYSKLEIYIYIYIYIYINALTQ